MLLLAFALLAPADTIRLKSGSTIVADQVAEKNGRIVYEVGDNTYAIPKSLVESIETSNPPEVRVPPFHSAMTNGDAESAVAPVGADAGNVIHDGRVDADALAALERAGRDHATAAGFAAAARFENTRGNRERARFYFERALMFAPRSPELLTEYAGVLVRLGHAADAIPFAERAARLQPDSADVFSVLGFADYSADRAADAIRAWTRALQLRPDAEIERYLAKARRELQTEADFSRAETGHFSVRYEGATVSDGLRLQIEQALEADYRDLGRQLGSGPQAAIAVALYTDQAFFDVTQAPAWTGAINDGKLRIPIQGLTGVTPDLARVLKHELAHSFINQASRGRCPQWLHEGIAQMLEPKSLGATRGLQLAEFYRQGSEIPLNALEVPFVSLAPSEAVLGYDEALAAVEYIRDTYGMEQLRSILQRIGDGSSTETALRATIHCGYSELEQRVGRYLPAKYGTS